MPIKYKSTSKENDEKIQKLLSSTYGCKICGKAISFNILKSEYCLMCKLKHSDQIREKKRKTAKDLEEKLKYIKQKKSKKKEN